jgi:hypothetical protein
MAPDELDHGEGARSSGPEALARRGGFTFVGTVREIGGATPGIPSGDDVAVVRVDSILRAPNVLKAHVGTDVTVRLCVPSGLEVDQQAVFSADSWIYGHGVALSEAGHWVVEGDLSAVRRRIVEVEQRLADESLIIAGRVAQTAEVERPGTGPRREHDPGWTEAIVAVDQVLGRSEPRRSEIVLFAEARDVAWLKAPKLHLDQTGVWILHKLNIEELGRGGYAVLDSLDSWPREELGRIEELIPTDA